MLKNITRQTRGSLNALLAQSQRRNALDIGKNPHHSAGIHWILVKIRITCVRRVMLAGAEYHHSLPYLPSCADAIRPYLFGIPAVYLPTDMAIPGISRTWYFGIRGTLLNSCHSYSPAHATPDVVRGPLPPRHPQIHSGEAIGRPVRIRASTTFIVSASCATQISGYD